MEDIEESVVWNVEILAESVERDDHPLTIAIFAFLTRLSSVALNSF